MLEIDKKAAAGGTKKVGRHYDPIRELSVRDVVEERRRSEKKE